MLFCKNITFPPSEAKGKGRPKAPNAQKGSPTSAWQGQSNLWGGSGTLVKFLSNLSQWQLGNNSENGNILRKMTKMDQKHLMHKERATQGLDKVKGVPKDSEEELSNFCPLLLSGS